MTPEERRLLIATARLASACGASGLKDYTPARDEVAAAMVPFETAQACPSYPMVEFYREFQGENGLAIIRRDRVVGIIQCRVGDPSMANVGLRIDGITVWVVGDYEAIRDWVRAD